MVQKGTQHISVKDKIVDAALALASAQPWGDISFDDIIQASTVDKADALEYFDDKADILAAYGRRLDRRALEEAGNSAENTDIRENLFDLLMARFDILNEDRDAILSILTAMKFDPRTAIFSLPHLGKSMGKMLEGAGQPAEGLRACAKITALTGIYLYVVKVWKDDDSPDMGKTMAALDKALGIAEEAANTLENGSFLSAFSSLKDRFKPE